MKTILVAEDENTMRKGLVRTLEEDGHRVFESADGEQAFQLFQANPVEIVLADLHMPGLNGLELLKRIKKLNPRCFFIMMTAYGSVESAVETIKEGAFDYITKPFSVDELELLIAKIEDQTKLVEENAHMREASKTQYTFHNMVGRSECMMRIFALIERVADSNSALLVRGESGTGKELIAAAIHHLSQRKSHPFIKVNCGALPEGVLESELFGHEKGAFTSAIARRIGRFELANTGTLFLDEIGDIPPSVQIRLLRVLQEQEFERVGGAETIKVDVRMIAATHRDLEKAIEENKFREDLYYRLNVIPIFVPALRDRKEDVPILVEHFLAASAETIGRRFEEVDPKAMELLVQYDWPGNVRELENVIKRAAIIGKDCKVILPKHLSFVNTARTGGLERSQEPMEQMTLSQKLAQVERLEIINALKRANWVQTHAAELLGVNRSGLRYKMKQLNIVPLQE